MFKTITQKIRGILSNLPMMLPVSSETSSRLLLVVTQAKEFVVAVHDKAPTVLLYSPTVSSVVKALEPELNAMGIVTLLKEPRLPNDQLILAHNDIHLAVMSKKDEEFQSFLNSPNARVGVTIGDIFPPGDLGATEEYTDEEDYGGYSEG